MAWFAAMMRAKLYPWANAMKKWEVGVGVDVGGARRGESILIEGLSATAQSRWRVLSTMLLATISSGSQRTC